MTAEPTVPCPQCRAMNARTDERCRSCGSLLAVGQLEVCSGPLRGRIFPVFRAPFTIGRAPDNDLSLPDLSVSRLHARILPEETGFAIEDLDSRFGVYVDGSRVKRAGLGEIARLKVGETLLHFSARDVGSKPTDPSVTSGITTAPREDLLLAVVEALGSTLVVSEVADRIIDGIMRVTRAERGFLLLEDPGPEPAERRPTVGGLTIRVARMAAGTSSGTFGISTSIVKRVLSSGTTLVTGNASRDPQFNPAESVMNLGLKTIVCLPLRVTGASGTAHMMGVIYADNQSHSTSFSEDSLKAAEALARHAALAIHNAQLFESEQRASRAKSAFLGAMSHELHTPLNAIIGYGEMIQERAQDRADEDDTDDAKRILDAGRHLLRLVDEVLDMSQLEAGHLRLQCEAVELEPLLRDSVEAARRAGQGRGVQLEATIPAGLRANAEPRRLCQVMSKLLDNAFAFTPKGTVRVSARAAEDDGVQWIEVEVADAGAGMSAEQAARVLEPFSQADPSTTRTHGGMGLGLPLSRRLCEAMGGALHLASVPGQGTTVTVRLPAAG